jgi:hypothetical protein
MFVQINMRQMVMIAWVADNSAGAIFVHANVRKIDQINVRGYRHLLIGKCYHGFHRQGGTLLLCHFWYIFILTAKGHPSVSVKRKPITEEEMKLARLRKEVVELKMERDILKNAPKGIRLSL